MGLGSKYLGWLNCLWVHVSKIVSYDGIDQDPIEMIGGLTQGALESAILFNLANVPLNLALINLETDQYFPIEHEMSPDLANRNRLLTYSDDSCVVLRFSAEKLYRDS